MYVFSLLYYIIFILILIVIGLLIIKIVNSIIDNSNSNRIHVNTYSMYILECRRYYYIIIYIFNIFKSKFLAI